MEKPKIVSAEEWQQARDELLKAEKEATRALDALAARRRRLPMVKFDNGYAFDTPTGTRTLIDLSTGEASSPSTSSWTSGRMTTARATPGSRTTSPIWPGWPSPGSVG